MAYGDVFKLDEISAFALADFAGRCDIDRRLLAREAQRMKNGIHKHAMALSQAPAYDPDERVFAQGIAEAAVAATAQLAETAKAASRLPAKHL